MPNKAFISTSWWMELQRTTSNHNVNALLAAHLRETSLARQYEGERVDHPCPFQGR